MDINQMTPQQRAARITVMLSLKSPMTPEESEAIVTPFDEWPESLKAKAGSFAELVRVEDERAKPPSPAK